MTVRILNILLVFFFLTAGACRSIMVKHERVFAEILERSALWNVAFFEKDVAKVMDLFSSDAQFASAGGKWQTKERGSRAFTTLLNKRPDLQWSIHPKDIKVNNDWGVAYETGNWSEWWTETDGTAKIDGTYFLMWKKAPSEPWLIHAAIFTPLSCTGESSYCRPRPLPPFIPPSRGIGGAKVSRIIYQALPRVSLHPCSVYC